MLLGMCLQSTSSLCSLDRRDKPPTLVLSTYGAYFSRETALAYLMVDLQKIYNQISFRKHRGKLYTSSCTSEQLYAQISGVTDDYISYVECILPKLLHLKREAKRKNEHPKTNLKTQRSFLEADTSLISDSKRFLEKMDEEVGSKSSSDGVGSDYLENLA